MSYSNYCLSPSGLSLSTSSADIILFRYVYPIVCTFAIVGNLLNLTVLLSRSMRSFSNLLLSSLAIADIIFLLTFIPLSMANFDIFAYNYWFRLIYFQVKKYSLALVNWTSAAAIWFLLAVCIERLIGIRSPLHTTKNSRPLLKTIFIHASIWLTTFFVTFHNYFKYYCLVRTLCYGTQLHLTCKKIDDEKWFLNQTNPHPASLKQYVKWSTAANALLVVIVPVFLLIIFNGMLIHYLRKSNQGILFLDNDNHNNLNEQMRKHQIERKVTITICAIVTCFTLTQTPSALLFIIKEIVSNRIINDQIWQMLFSIAGCFVIIGKSMNFILFCLSSTNFRRKLMQMLNKKRRDSSTTLHSRMTSIKTMSFKRSDSVDENIVMMQHPI